MTKELLKALNETKNELVEEGKDQLKRAEALEWDVLEKILREKGYDDRDIAFEKDMFECMLKTSRFLANYK